MWRTEMGDRVLAGPEAAVFRRGLANLVFWIERIPQYEAGVTVFDRLRLPEKLAVLELVGRALLVDQGVSPELTAVNEGAIAAVYDQVLTDVELEIEYGQSDFRQLVRKACREFDLYEPPTRSRNAGEWAEAVEELMFLVLWDVDWEAEYVKPDEPPDMIDAIRESMGIDPDYYSAVAPDPNPTQLAKIRLSLRELCREGEVEPF